MFQRKIIIHVKENSIEDSKKYIAYIGKEKKVAFGKTAYIAFKKLVDEMNEEDLNVASNK